MTLTASAQTLSLKPNFKQSPPPTISMENKDIHWERPQSLKIIRELKTKACVFSLKPDVLQRTTLQGPFFNL